MFLAVDHLKNLLSNLLLYCFCFIFWFFGHEEFKIFSPPIRGSNLHPLHGKWSLNHWTAREVPHFFFLNRWILLALFIHHPSRAQLCLNLCNPMDYSPPASSVCEISQARTLEWAPTAFSRGSSQPRDQTHISCTSCIVDRFFML